MDKVTKDEKLIYKVVKNVEIDLLDKGINDKLEDTLAIKYNRANKNDYEYIKSLKLNIIFYKDLIKSIEEIFIKGIVDKKIFTEEEFESKMKYVLTKNKYYINEVMKDIDTYIDKEYKSKLDIDSKNIENDYRYLSIYNDVLKVTLRYIALNQNEYDEILSKDYESTLKELQSEIGKSVDNILSKYKKNEKNIKIEDTNENKKFRQHEEYIKREEKFKKYHEKKSSIEVKTEKKSKIGLVIVATIVVIMVGVLLLNNALAIVANKPKEKIPVTNISSGEEEKLQEGKKEELYDSSKNENNDNIENIVEYSVYSGAYRNKSNAQNAIKVFSNKGIDSKIVEEDGYSKIKIGSASTYDQVMDIVKNLEDLSIKSYILAYDTEIERIFDEFNNTILNENDENIEYQYNTIRKSLIDRHGYERYLNILDETYNSYKKDKENL